MHSFCILKRVFKGVKVQKVRFYLDGCDDRLHPEEMNPRLPFKRGARILLSKAFQPVEHL